MTHTVIAEQVCVLGSLFNQLLDDLLVDMLLVLFFGINDPLASRFILDHAEHR